MSAKTIGTLTIFDAMNGFVMGTLEVAYLGDEAVEVLVTESNADQLKIARAGVGAEVRRGAEVLCSGLIVMTTYEYATRLLTIRLRAVRPVGTAPEGQER